MKPENSKRVFYFFHTCTYMTLEWKPNPIFLFFSLFSLFLTDIDECKTYPSKCQVNAICNNTNGSYVCKCKPGYTGDGRNCAGTVNNLRSLQIPFNYYNECCCCCCCCCFLFWYRGKPSFNFCNIDRGTYPTFLVITENLFSVFEKISCFRNPAKGWQQP